MRGLLNFRALNSLKNTLGANHPASLTVRRSSAAIVSRDTGVTLTGRFAGSSGTFCAVTSIGGRVAYTCCAAARPAEAVSASTTKTADWRARAFDIGKFSHTLLDCR